MVWPDLDSQEAHAAASQILEAVRTLRVGNLLGLTTSAGMAFTLEAQERDELVNLAARRCRVARKVVT